MSKVQIGTKAQREFLKQLSIVFADELRLKIVTELYMQEMSPTTFHAAFGGGSVPRVYRHFRRLAATGWIALTREARGGKRRGATEHFYRAPRLAVFDKDTWSLVPYSMRVNFSWKVFRQLAERVREAIEAGTLDAEPPDQIRARRLALDEVGWSRVGEAVDRLFESLKDERTEAARRIQECAGTSVLATVGLGLFESAPSGDLDGDARDWGLVESQESPIPLLVRLSKVLSDPISLRIVSELCERTMSATEFHAEFGGASVEAIRRRFRVLVQLGWLKQVGRQTGGKRRGAVERFYRATGPMLPESPTWARVSDRARATRGWQAFEQLGTWVEESLRAGIFEARTDNHFSWSLLRLDAAGWERVRAAIDELNQLVLDEQERAAARLAESGEAAIEVTVALAAFESPEDKIRP